MAAGNRSPDLRWTGPVLWGTDALAMACVLLACAGTCFAVTSAFLFLAILGFKRGLLLVAAVIAGYGVFDFFHHSLIDNPGVPRWWPGFCLAFDVGFGGYVAMRQYLALRFQSVVPFHPNPVLSLCVFFSGAKPF